ncbi:cysteine hydrolase [Glutamicibacter sp. MNS18]|uniref:cysteine hydrolase family protein n=1 Tax=Glutamicibacter sp. MNS18 TaxID=2989817 RepID=UPI002235EFCF|nr:cysteine hydrolase [Glutamicibacter sp. MNS18]MCW4465564.1 cysteine hydrolase [Glutamicibacter sp. MNS18]
MATLTPQATALLVVHLQHDIVSPHTAFGALFNPQAVERQVVSRCAQAMSLVRSAGGLVVPLRIVFKDDYSDLDPSLPLLQMVEQAGCLKESDPGSQIVAEAGVDERDLVVTHQRPGPFSGTDLHQQLQDRGIRNVVVCGVATNASVEGAVRQAADLGYDTFVLADASSAAAPAAHEASLESMGLFARQLSVAQLGEAITPSDASP